MGNLEDNCLGDDSGRTILNMLDMNAGLQLTSLNMSGNHLEEATLDRMNLFIRTHKAELLRAKLKEKKAMKQQKKGSKGNAMNMGRRKSTHSGKNSRSHSRSRTGTKDAGQH